MKDVDFIILHPGNFMIGFSFTPHEQLEIFIGLFAISIKF